MRTILKTMLTIAVAAATIAGIAKPQRSNIASDGIDGLDSSLPFDAQVEYLESTGTQWIDTGVFLSSHHTVSLRSSMTGNNSMFGSVVAGQYFFGGQTTGGSIYNAFFGSTVARLEGTRIRNVYTATISKDGLVVDGVGAVHTLSGNFSCTATCGVFCRNSQSGGFYANDIAASGSRLYWLSISDGAVLVRDFIPVRFTNEFGNAEGGMYDTVSNEIFRNAGKGAFIIGPDL